MEPRITLDDLPSDWSAQFGQDYISELRKQIIDDYTGGRRVVFWSFSPGHDLRTTPEKLSSPLEIQVALRLYNAATFCYTLEPTKIERGVRVLTAPRERESCQVVHSQRWLTEAFDQ